MKQQMNLFIEADLVEALKAMAGKRSMSSYIEDMLREQFKAPIKEEGYKNLAIEKGIAWAADLSYNDFKMYFTNDFYSNKDLVDHARERLTKYLTGKNGPFNLDDMKAVLEAKFGQLRPQEMKVSDMQILHSDEAAEDAETEK